MLTVYKASAGSGKTFTLAYEYIKIILARPPGMVSASTAPTRSANSAAAPTGTAISLP